MLGIGNRRVDGIDHGVDEPYHSRALTRFQTNALILFRALLLVIVFGTPVIEFREAVQAGSLALGTLPDTQQATLAHRHIVCPDGNGGSSILYLVVEALLVVVERQLVDGNSLWQEVIGDELIEQIVGVLVVVVHHGFGIVALFLHPVLHVFHIDFPAVLAERSLPELVGFCEERKAVLAMLWRRNRPAAELPVELGESTRLIERLVAFVPHPTERIYQAASLHHLAHHAQVALEVVRELVERAAQRLVARVDYIAHFVDEAVDGLYVAILFRDGTHAVNREAVQVLLIVGDADFAVGHGSDFELLVRFRELGGEVHPVVLRAVQNAVQDNDGANAVLRAFVGESVPTGFGDNLLDDQRVQVELNGVVRRSEASVAAIGRHELIDARLADVAHGLFLHQPDILAELRMILQIAGNRAFLEDVSGRRIHILVASQEDNG